MILFQKREKILGIDLAFVIFHLPMKSIHFFPNQNQPEAAIFHGSYYLYRVRAIIAVMMKIKLYFIN